MNASHERAMAARDLYARIYDANIAGHLSKRYDTVTDAMSELEDNRGSWHDYTGEGVALLNNPSTSLYLTDPALDDDTYPDLVIELSDQGEALYNFA